MKIGLLKETKIPEDNRVALTPTQVKELSREFPDVEFKVQSSPTRAYADNEYSELGITVCDDMSDCDLLLGIKEADIATLLPNKHYMFFGHIAKRQPYNIPLFKTLINNANTFSDYEYLVDDHGVRLVAFGWYAGVVGLYYTLQGWGKKLSAYELPKPHLHFTIEELIANLKNANLGNIRMVLTGTGRVSQGAQYILQQIGAKYMAPQQFIEATSEAGGVVYTVAPLEELVAPDNADEAFDFDDFIANPEAYHSTFDRFAMSADILLCCHFWSNGQPVYLNEESFRQPGFRLKMIGDITCDIMGSVKSTLRPATHDAPWYDYNPATAKEEPAFSNPENITVMAVDTCPNALPRVTSQYFGEQLIKHVLGDLLRSKGNKSVVLDRATILKDGRLTEYFSSLTDYVESF